MLRVAAAALGLLLAATWVLAAPALMQDRLLYFPTRVGVAQASATGLQPWPSAQDFRGLLAPPPAQARGTVIVFHGNAGHAGQREFYVHALAPLGLRVLLVLGESLGAGVAAAAAARQREQVAGLVLITPWDRLQQVASYHYPWLPVRWLLRDRYDSAAHLGAFERPVAVVIASNDDIVPARFGQALYASLAAPKRLWTLDAGHNDWPLQLDARTWQQIVDFALAP